MTGVYELQGNERKEVKREKVPCGDAIKTSYYHSTSGELLREDVNIEVSEEFMRNAGFTTQTGFGQ